MVKLLVTWEVESGEVRETLEDVGAGLWLVGIAVKMGYYFTLEEV